MLPYWLIGLAEIKTRWIFMLVWEYREPTLLSMKPHTSDCNNFIPEVCHSFMALYDHQFGTINRKIKMPEKVCLSGLLSRCAVVSTCGKASVNFSSCDANKQVSRWPLCLLWIFIYRSCLDDSAFVGRPLLHARQLANSPSSRSNQASPSETSRGLFAFVVASTQPAPMSRETLGKFL